MSRCVPEGGFNLAPFKRPREERPSHLKFIRSLPCVACAAGAPRFSAVQAAHLRSSSMAHGKQPTGGQQKPHDRWALPLCASHHAEQHDQNEMIFWQRYKIDLHVLALVLWGMTGDEHGARDVIALHAAGLTR